MSDNTIALFVILVVVLLLVTYCGDPDLHDVLTHEVRVHDCKELIKGDK